MKHPIIFKKQKEPVIGHDTKKNKFLCPSILKFKKNLYRLYFSEDKKKRAENLYRHSSILENQKLEKQLNSVHFLCLSISEVVDDPQKIDFFT